MLLQFFKLVDSVNVFDWYFSHPHCSLSLQSYRIGNLHNISLISINIDTYGVDQAEAQSDFLNVLKIAV